MWNPWREIRRLQREAEIVAREHEKTVQALLWATDAHLRQRAVIAFLCDRDGIEPQMIQVDDAGTVRLGLPDGVETRGSA